MKHLREPIFYLQWLLIILSLIALLFIHLDTLKLKFDLSTTGFINYLNYYEPFKVLFSAAIVIITTFLGIERLGLMIQANMYSYRASNRTLWIQTVKEFYSEIKRDNPYICKEISRKIVEIHDFLFELSYKIKDKEELKKFFDKFFLNRVQFFEEQNIKYQNIVSYHDDKHSYSFMDFKYIFNVLINADESYKDLQNDLQEIYQNAVLKFSKQHIDKELFEISAKNYSMLKSKGQDLKYDDK